MSYGASSVLAQHVGTTSAPEGFREGGVNAEIRDLHAQLQALGDVTGKLRQRIAPLMLERPTPVTGTNQVDPVNRCKTAAEIHAAVDLACNITANVNDMLCCLEL